MSDRKTYVLDTSVLLSSPRAMFAFAEHEVVLPLVVIKELESKKHDPELGQPARSALRHLEGLRNRPDSNLREGVVDNSNAGGSASTTGVLGTAVRHVVPEARRVARSTSMA